MVKKFSERFMKKNCKKPPANRTWFGVPKVIRKKHDKLDVKWKGYDNSFNSWIDKKDIVK